MKYIIIRRPEDSVAEWRIMGRPLPYTYDSVLAATVARGEHAVMQSHPYDYRIVPMTDDSVAALMGAIKV